MTDRHITEDEATAAFYAGDRDTWAQFNGFVSWAAYQEFCDESAKEWFGEEEADPFNDDEDEDVL